MKIFDAGLWALAIVLSLFGVIVAIDLSTAIEAQGCSQLMLAATATLGA